MRTHLCMLVSASLALSAVDVVHAQRLETRAGVSLYAAGDEDAYGYNVSLALNHNLGRTAIYAEAGADVLSSNVAVCAIGSVCGSQPGPGHVLEGGVGIVLNPDGVFRARFGGVVSHRVYRVRERTGAGAEGALQVNFGEHRRFGVELRNLFFLVEQRGWLGNVRLVVRP